MTQVNFSVKQKQTQDIDNRLMVAKGKERCERDGLGISG